MSARRQPSTTSLSKFYRTGEHNGDSRTLDFCNNFWGPNDVGVDVLFARMRGAIRTMEELRNFWKERAAIEEDYAKRLAKLSKTTLGKDEVGDLRISFDTMLAETERQSGYHLTLYQQIKNDLEGQVAVFCSKQAHHKKVYQNGIEKQFKQKQTQESYVTKAREKYEQDCMRINSYTAQSSLMQGKELEKLHLKLERTQQTVQQNERDFANFARAFQDTTAKWEVDWKAFCDTCQDIEEDRMEFTKDNLWAYANAVSTVCVSDDESCEKTRVALEQVDTDKEIENFVRDYGTGNDIQNPPQFVNYNSPDATTSMKPSMRPANFIRSSHRSSQRNSPLPQTQPIPSDTEEEFVNTAGRGAGHRNSQNVEPSLSRRPSRSGAQLNGVNGHSPSSSIGGQSVRSGVSPHSAPGGGVSPQPQQHITNNISRKPTNASYRPPPPPVDSLAEPIDSNAETYIKVGANAYKVDLSKDPQQQHHHQGRPGTSASNYSSASAASPSKANNQAIDDPLARQLEELKNAVSMTSTNRRGSVRAGTTPSRRESLALPGSSAPQASSSPSPTKRDYRQSADMIVGAPPPTTSSMSRSASPNPPMAAFMVPKSPVSQDPDVEGVVAGYQQSFPGERKSVSLSRAGSRRSSFAGVPPPDNQPDSRGRSQSQLGHAGVGAHGSRSPSPAPIRRSPSPNPGQIMQHVPPPPTHQQMGSMSSMSSIGRAPSAAASHLQQHQQVVQRAASPNQVGIALDPSGRVSHDEMAQRYQQQHQQQQSYSRPVSVVQQQQPIQVPPPPPLTTTPAQQYAAQAQRQTSYGNAYQAQPPGYGGVSPSPYSQPQQQQPLYAQQQQQAQSAYAPRPQSVPYQAQAPPVQQHQPQYHQQQPSNAGYGVNGGLQHGQSVSVSGGGYYQQPQHQQGYSNHMQPQQQQSLHPQHTSTFSQSGFTRSPSPQPPAQHTEDGSVIKFYVQALYDYEATIDEEFSFQAGDIIAVTQTPEDGWWSGELLDENRRQPGRHVFPSNFVRLF